MVTNSIYTSSRPTSSHKATIAITPLQIHLLLLPCHCSVICQNQEVADSSISIMITNIVYTSSKPASSH
uniref:Uncharacterized protein n=1 Tax=Arion vulgaris TaxID=1028688 RepID=A0A0B7BJY1_9EUPU